MFGRKRLAQVFNLSFSISITYIFAIYLHMKRVQSLSKPKIKYLRTENKRISCSVLSNLQLSNYNVQYATDVKINVVSTESLLRQPRNVDLGN